MSGALLVVPLLVAATAFGGTGLFYRQPPEDSPSGWERQSLPVGCGHFGANVFGLVGDERVQIGASGQIKEYREENAYGEIGEKAHRHISRLMGLMPGTLINRTTPAWFEAATTPTVCSRKGKIPNVRFRGKPFRVGR